MKNLVSFRQPESFLQITRCKPNTKRYFLSSIKISFKVYSAWIWHFSIFYESFNTVWILFQFCIHQIILVCRYAFPRSLGAMVQYLLMSVKRHSGWKMMLKITLFLSRILKQNNNNSKHHFSCSSGHRLPAATTINVDFCKGELA